MCDKNGRIQHQVGHHQDEEVDQHSEGDAFGDGGGDSDSVVIRLMNMILRRLAVTWVQSLKKMHAPFLEVIYHIVIIAIREFNVGINSMSMINYHVHGLPLTIILTNTQYSSSQV